MTTERRDIAIRQFVATGLVLVAALFVIAHCAGCFPELKQDIAAASYEAQQMRCVEQYANRADIDRCRAKVKLAWLVGDAGAEGGDR